MIKKLIKKCFSSLKRCKVVKAEIVTLAPSELLRGRTALVTGGTSGIGKAIAEAYLNAGASVIITGRNFSRIEAAISEIKSNTGRECIWGFELDNTNISSFDKKIENILNYIGGRQIDILVNNAGVRGGHISKATEEEYDTILETNLKGVFFLAKFFGHYFKENGIKGNILNIASSAAVRPAISAYQVSKWGVRGLTQGLARVLAPYGIVVNGIAPGPTATPMLNKEHDGNIAHEKNLTGRYAMPEEIANMAVILASDMGRTIIGDIIFMSGGGGIITNEDVDYSF